MILSFTLSMPGVNSWNGKWTGNDKLYAKVVNFGKTKKGIEKSNLILSKPYHSYSFGDGWRAGVTIKMVDAKEAIQIRRKTDGFCGYDWMVDSIIEHGEIR